MPPFDVKRDGHLFKDDSKWGTWRFNPGSNVFCDFCGLDLDHRVGYRYKDSSLAGACIGRWHYVFVCNECHQAIVNNRPHRCRNI